MISSNATMTHRNYAALLARAAEAGIWTGRDAKLRAAALQRRFNRAARPPRGRGVRAPKPAPTP